MNPGNERIRVHTEMFVYTERAVNTVHIANFRSEAVWEILLPLAMNYRTIQQTPTFPLDCAVHILYVITRTWFVKIHCSGLRLDLC